MPNLTANWTCERGRNLQRINGQVPSKGTRHATN